MCIRDRIKVVGEQRGIKAATDEIAELSELAGQGAGTRCRAVCNHDFPGLQLEQRCEHAAGGSAGAENQDAGSAHRHTAVVLQIAHQAFAVGIVAENLVLVLYHQRVDGAGALCARRKLVGKPGCRNLVRQGDIQAAPAVQKEVHHVPAKLCRGHIEASIDHRLLGLAREQAMDERRPAMRDWVADDSVLIRSSVHRAPQRFAVESGRKPRLKCRCACMICNRVGVNGLLIQQSDTFRPVARCDIVTLVRRAPLAYGCQCADTHPAGACAVEAGVQFGQPKMHLRGKLVGRIQDQQARSVQRHP